MPIFIFEGGLPEGVLRLSLTRTEADFGYAYSSDRAMECSTVPSKVIASAFALTAFVAALLVGFAAGNPAATILWRAVVVLIVCRIVGGLVGRVAQRTVDEYIERYKQDNPIPPDAAIEEMDVDEDDAPSHAGEAEPELAPKSAEA